MDRSLRAPRILTVGDGDLSFSLAIARAFGDSIELTATTLLSAEELCQTYASAAENIRLLSEMQNVRVVHGVDATAMRSSELGPHDRVLFAHPHLGLADLQDVELHSRRHQVLIAHYLESAAELLTTGMRQAGVAHEGGERICGFVHLTLCGNQPNAWHAAGHAHRLGLGAARGLDVAQPPELHLPSGTTL